MEDAELHEVLVHLGIDEDSHRALALLPLVQVAWADGTVQEEERALISTLATERYHLWEEGRRVLENWLRYRPSKAYLERGRQALLALVSRAPEAIDPDTLEDVIALSEHVATAAGGFFGLLRVEASEREALAEIAAALSVSRGTAWHEPAEREAVEEDTDDEESEVTVDFHPPLDISPDAPRAVLVHLEGDEERVHPLGGEPLSIGRARSNGVQIAGDAKVSRHHCELFEQGGRFYARDLDSANGVFVNGERVMERRLFGGEELSIGASRFQFKRV
jgi:tellurite resistance protein